ncbi:hypothetical protein BDZ89DRAFT_1148590 [Hymenopellis radicata]|nr:hypothetical protein BDZ89DRAFT_1148590 [Hymenopellis radicata]
MSVSLQPRTTLVFPSTYSASSTASHPARQTITNYHNDRSVAFKIKTTAPKLYCVRPNSGRVKPVMLQATKEELPLNAK